MSIHPDHFSIFKFNLFYIWRREYRDQIKPINIYE